MKEILRRHIEREIERRDGDWASFRASILERIETMEREGSDEGEEERGAWSDRERRDLISGCLTFLSTPFASFRLRTWAGLGLATAVSVLLLSLATTRLPGLNARKTAAPAAGIAESRGRVSLDRVSFEGTLTVMNEGGLTVVWLTDSAS